MSTEPNNPQPDDQVKTAADEMAQVIRQVVARQGTMPDPDVVVEAGEPEDGPEQPA